MRVLLQAGSVFSHCVILVEDLLALHIKPSIMLTGRCGTLVWRVACRGVNMQIQRNPTVDHLFFPMHPPGAATHAVPAGFSFCFGAGCDTLNLA